MGMLSRRAYGFRNFENYRLIVLAHCGWYLLIGSNECPSPVNWVEPILMVARDRIELPTRGFSVLFESQSPVLTQQVTTHNLRGESAQATPCSNLPTVTNNPTQAENGFFFNRTDSNEYRWVGPDAQGELGSTWVDPACWARLGNNSVSGDWQALQQVAPGAEPAQNPCIDSPTEPTQQPEPVGFRFSRSDVFEFRWIGPDADGVQGSEWIDPNCYDTLSATTVTGDWAELIEIAPGGNPASNPCRAY